MYILVYLHQVKGKFFRKSNGAFYPDCIAGFIIGLMRCTFWNPQNFSRTHSLDFAIYPYRQFTIGHLENFIEISMDMFGRARCEWFNLCFAMNKSVFLADYNLPKAS